MTLLCPICKAPCEFEVVFSDESWRVYCERCARAMAAKVVGATLRRLEA